MTKMDVLYSVALASLMNNIFRFFYANIKTLRFNRDLRNEE